MSAPIRRVISSFRSVSLTPSSIHRFHSSRSLSVLSTTSQSDYNRNLLAVLVSGSLISAYYLQSNSVYAQQTTTNETKNSLPIYTRKQVAEHKTKETGIWVAFGDGVYDITKFIAEHPGGPDKIILAAGSAVEPFWKIYQQHMNPHVHTILEKYRIGNLAPGEEKPVVDEKDPYVNDPSRHPALIVRSERPYNGETPAALLCEDLITPTELWYVRHHLPVPKVDPKTYRLEVGLANGKFLSLSLDELKTKYPSHEIIATILCTGLRRADFNKIKETAGLAWDVGAISTAKFKGVLLKDLLTAAGLDLNKHTDIKHVQFKGLDSPYDGSIPIEKAMSPTGDVLIAYEMNDQPVPADHGFPLRVVVPGYVGARQVKWVSKITASPEEAHSTWQRGPAYKGFNPSITSYDGIDVEKVFSIQEYPVVSAICNVKSGQTVNVEHEYDDDGNITKSYVLLKGYAWSGGGRGIIRVDVSPDGKTWYDAKLKRPGQPYGREWAWSLWEARVPVQLQKGEPNEYEFVCKAIDTSYNSQPDSVQGIWNARGVLNHAWHRVKVQVKDE